MIVPDKTIAYIPIIPDKGTLPFDGDISTFLTPLNKDHKRSWFDQNFYKCLPLSIGNMQGFVFSCPFSFSVLWNGGKSPNSVKIQMHEIDPKIKPGVNHVQISSEFGSGILTAHMPVILKTPPGVNLMTIAAPNYPLPGLSAMTGVVEADNLRFTFTINLKIDAVNVPIFIKKDYPLAGIIPIPRYFCDSFSLESAYNIFDSEIVEEERKVEREQAFARSQQIKNGGKSAGLYYKGVDVRGNKFKDHQLPKSSN